MDASLFLNRFARSLSNPLGLLFPAEQDRTGPIGAGAHGSIPSMSAAAFAALLNPRAGARGFLFQVVLSCGL